MAVARAICGVVTLASLQRRIAVHTAAVRTEPPDAMANGATVGDGRFVILGVLGEGAQAKTYEALDKRHGAAVALKRFSVRGANSWKDVELAEREASVLATLSHPLLPRYIAHFEEDGALFLAMEKMEGSTLLALRTAGQFQRRDVLAFLNDMAATLDYLHGRVPPIIHRDIKPSNVLRRPDGRYVIVDFGSVAHVLKPGGGSTVVGTFGYMAPEQFQGRALRATDLYAVAATALAMLTGQDPDRLPHKGLAIDVEAALGPERDSRWVRFLTTALNPDPDVRGRQSLTELLRVHGLGPEAASASAAGGEPAGRSRASSQSGKSRYEPQNHEQPRHEQRWSSKKQRREDERRWERDESRRERDERRRERDERRWERGVHRYRSRHGRLIPQPLFVGALLGLWVARLAVLAVVVLAVPLLLMLLSVVFGSGLRRAARRSREAGRRAQSALRDAAARLRAVAPVIDTDGVPLDGVRVETEPAAKPKSSAPRSELDNLEGDLADIEARLEHAVKASERHRD
jgi:serine/threonine protein kinase